MNILAQVTLSELSPIWKAVAVLAGIVALFIALKVGQVVMKLFFGLIGLALLGGAAWWFLAKH